MEISEEEATQINAIVSRLMSVGEGYSPYLGESAKIYNNTPAERALLTKMMANGFIDSIPPTGIKGIKYIPNKVTAEISNANGILNYLENVRIEKQKLLDKSEVEERLKLAQLENIEYEKTNRELREENLRLSNQNTANQIEVQPFKNQELKLSIVQKYWWIVATCTAAGGYLWHMF